MAQAARDMAELMAERMKLVMEMTQLNAEHLRLCQIAGGAEIGVMTQVRNLEETGDDNSQGQARLDNAQDRDRDAKAALADCERRITQLEADIETLDKEIANANAQ